LDRQEVAPQEEITSVSQPTYSIDSFGTIIFVVVLVEIIILVGLNFYQKSRITSLTNQLAAKQTQLQGPNYATLNNEVNQVLSGSAQLQAVLASKVKWSTFYSDLNAVTPKTAQLTTLSIAGDGSFKADGKADSLATLAKALVAWQQGVGQLVTPFSSVTLASDTLNGSTGSSNQVSFSISGQINLGVLR
jgi:hypothetical protein